MRQRGARAGKRPSHPGLDFSLPPHGPLPPSRQQLVRVRDDQGLLEGHWLAAVQGLVQNCTPHCILAFVTATMLTQVRGD